MDKRRLIAAEEDVDNDIEYVTLFHSITTFLNLNKYGNSGRSKLDGSEHHKPFKLLAPQIVSGDAVGSGNLIHTITSFL